MDALLLLLFNIYYNKILAKQFLNILKKIFSNLDFLDDVPEDPFNGGDVHLNGIKAHLYMTTFLLHESI